MNLSAYLPTGVLKAGPEDEIERLAQALEPGLRRAFLDGIKRLKDRLDLTEIARLLARGDVEAVIRLLATETVTREMLPLQETMRAGAARAVRFGLELGGGRPEMASQEMLDYARRASLNLLVEVGAETRASIRDVLTEGFEYGRPPAQMARQMRGVVGLTERQTRAVLNYREALEAGGAGALGRELRDRRFDGSVRTGNLPPERVDRMVERYEARHLAHRADMIARTESIRIANGGNDAAFQALDAAGLLDGQRRYWIVARDERTCPICLGIARLNRKGVAIGAPFRSEEGSIAHPPAHPNCRCTVVLR